MFIQNPYGQGANVPSALNGLSATLRDMFQQEMQARQADRQNQALIKSREIELAQLGLEGEKQALLGQLNLDRKSVV